MGSIDQATGKIKSPSQLAGKMPSAKDGQYTPEMIQQIQYFDPAWSPRYATEFIQQIRSVAPWWSPDGPPADALPPVVLAGEDGDRITRAGAYLKTLPPSIQGSQGSSARMWAARVVRWGFCLDEATCLHLFREHFNPRCQPEWSERELKHKLADADKPGFGYRKGWLLEQQRDYHPTDAYKDDPFFTEFARGDRPASPISAPAADIASLPPDPPSPPAASHRDCACSDHATATLALTEAAGQKVGSVPASPPCELPPIGIKVTRCPTPACIPMRGQAGTLMAGITACVATRCRRWSCPGCRTLHQWQHAEKVRLTIKYCTGGGGAPRLALGIFDDTERRSAVQSLRRAGAEVVTVRTTREAASLSGAVQDRKTTGFNEGEATDTGTPAVLIVAVIKADGQTPKGFMPVGVTEACNSFTSGLLGIQLPAPGKRGCDPSTTRRSGTRFAS